MPVIGYAEVLIAFSRGLITGTLAADRTFLLIAIGPGALGTRGYFVSCSRLGAHGARFHFTRRDRSRAGHPASGLH